MKTSYFEIGGNATKKRWIKTRIYNGIAFNIDHWRIDSITRKYI